MEGLLDPLKDRSVTSFPAPIAKPLDSSSLFQADGLPRWKVLRDLFSREGRLHKSDAMLLIAKAAEIFRREPNLISIQDPITVVGDIHGQFYDLLKILDIGGNPETTKYLFLGDFVDRGMFSFEVLLLLYALKINYPNTITMLRGNHESRQMTTMFSFRKECLYKHDLELYDAVMTSFDSLPLACVLNGSFLAVHGGVSPDLKTLKDINSINRMMEPPRSGLLCDLLWSDPVDSADGRTSEAYRPNDARGCSFFFGGDATKKLLKDNDLMTIIRGHEVQKDGFKMQFWNGCDFPSIITIFSAPNYCDCYKNKGAIIKFTNGTLNIQQYNYAKHPYVLPEFMDVFSWSIPFVIEKVVKMLYGIIKPRGNLKKEVDHQSLERFRELEESISKSSELRSENIEKIVAHIREFREKNEKIIENQLAFSDGVCVGVPVISNNMITDDDDIFKRAINIDKVNEIRPKN